MGSSFEIAVKPSLLNVSFKNFKPPGGTWIKTFLPIQKTIVANNIRIPGTPNATWEPNFIRRIGVSIVEIKAPKFIDK